MGEITTNQVPKHRNHPKGTVPNPTGVGGFKEHPENQSPGGWKKENVLSYQYKRFLNMNIAEYEAFAKTPKDKMTMAEYGAYHRIAQMRKSLPDAKEIADRVEGKAVQQVELKAEIFTIDSVLE